MTTRMTPRSIQPASPGAVGMSAAVVWLLAFALVVPSTFCFVQPAHAEEKAPSEGKEGDAPTKKIPGPPLYEPDDLIVNLSVPLGKRPVYLKIKLALELTRESDIEKLEPLKARLADTLQVYLRELRVEDLQGSVGIVRLRSELLAEINNAVKPVEVRDLLFREILVQ